MWSQDFIAFKTSVLITLWVSETMATFKLPVLGGVMFLSIVNKVIKSRQTSWRLNDVVS